MKARVTIWPIAGQDFYADYDLSIEGDKRRFMKAIEAFTENKVEFIVSATLPSQCNI